MLIIIGLDLARFVLIVSQCNLLFQSLQSPNYVFKINLRLNFSSLLRRSVKRQKFWNYNSIIKNQPVKKLGTRLLFIYC